MSTPKPADRHQIVPAGVLDILATLANYAGPANQHLDEVLRAAKVANPDGDPVRDVVHYDAIHAWCQSHPELAAKIVLAVVYLTNSRCFVQIEREPPAADAVTSDAPPAAAEPAEPATA